MTTDRIVKALQQLNSDANDLLLNKDEQAAINASIKLFKRAALLKGRVIACFNYPDWQNNIMDEVDDFTNLNKPFTSEEQDAS